MNPHTVRTMKNDIDFRVKALLGFALVSAFGLLTVQGLTSVGVIVRQPFQDWTLLDRLCVIFGCAVLADVSVLASVYFGIKRFDLFSRLDKILTHLPIGVFGLGLIIFATYTVFTEGYDYRHSLLGISEPAAMFFGWFLCFWVFLFYKREKSDCTR